MTTRQKHNRLSFKNLFHQYLSGELKLERYQWAGIILLVVVLSGMFGWFFEFIFYFLTNGMKEFYMQGGNFLPWMNLYAIGAILILATTYKFRNYPWAVFFISMVVSGILELVSGWLVYTLFDGARYWDYNNGILNFGNIGGFVCLGSVLFFGISALILMYVLIPMCVLIAKRMSKKTFLTLAITLFTIIIIDEIYNLLASKVFGWPDAMAFYRSIGWKYFRD